MRPRVARTSNTGEGGGKKLGRLRMEADGTGDRRTSLLAWEVPADQEEPWRRFLQELAGPRREEYAESRRRLGVSAESVWFAPRPSGGGIVVVILEADEPQWAFELAHGQFAASTAPFDSWYGTQMGRLFGCDPASPPRVAGGENLFAWREAPGEGRRGPSPGR